MTSQQQTFGAWLRSKRLDARLTMDELAKKAKVSKQYLSVLERAAPHALTGKPVTPKVAVVDRLAEALSADKDEARTAAGYASESVQTFQKPTTLEQFLGILEAIGVDIQNFHAPPFDDSPEFYHALLEDLARFIEFKLYTPPSRTFSLGDVDEKPERRRESPPLAHFPERRHKAG